jgi:hypothetical protein
MLRENAIRIRVDRILSGDIQPHDINLLFADLRFLQGCPAVIQDLAHFAAHRSNKDRGHTLDNSTRLFTCLEAYISGQVNTWKASSGYSDAGLAEALKSFLTEKGIFQTTELTDLSNLTRAVALYGVASMHGCILKPKDGSSKTLAIRIGTKSTLEIGCMAPMLIRPEDSCQSYVNLCVFQSSLDKIDAIGRLQSDLPTSDSAKTVEVICHGQLRYLE